MKRTVLAFLAAGLVAHAASADPTWSQISFTASPSNAAKVVAAADAFMASEVGKTFPGRLLLQANIADGSNPATHSFVPVYKNTADRETFVQKMLPSKDWANFQTAMENASEPVGTVLYDTVKSWGDINDTDTVWMAHAFTVSDPAGFVKAIESYMNTATGKTFPGQAYLSAVVAGGMSPVSHVISVGYASEVEMDAWRQTRNASADWAAYQKASGPTAEYLGGSLARTAKSWGPGTLEEMTTP